MSESETEHVTVSEGGSCYQDQKFLAGSARTERGSLGREHRASATGKDQVFEYNGSRKMQSASVIKVFIMGAVYDRNPVIHLHRSAASR